MSKKSNIVEFVAKAEIAHPGLYDYTLSDYINAITKIEIICKTCNSHFFQSPNNHLAGKGCRLCAHRKSSVNQSADCRNSFIEDAIKIHGHTFGYDLVDYKKACTKVKIRCYTHGIFEQTPQKHIGRKRGCPKCRISKGEREVAMVLDSLGVLYTREMSFSGCVSKLPLKFDFYVESRKLLIEFQGSQHYQIDKWTNSHEALVIRQHRDGLKRLFCLVNGFNLVEIPYFNMSKIRSILTNILVK